jgi:ATP-dependent RNA helicase RhlE
MSPDHSETVPGFAHFDLHPLLHRGIADAGYVEPRPIQEQTIPAALEGRDILGLAQTGTGKTAAFALPVLDSILAEPADGPIALVVAPTRELANQISADIRAFARHTKIQVATVFGGVSQKSQVSALRKRPEILVACPGRLLDLMNQGIVRLDTVEMLVLDEADHMFDMGFLPDIRRILAALPEDRQNLLWSATMPREIRRLADDLLHEPHVVELNHSQPIDTIEHALLPVDGQRKVELLEHVLREDGFVSAIVFTRTKHRAKRLARQLDSAGHKAIALQGNMSQNQRERALDGFRDRKFDVLVATDIAARGLDIEQVSHVINFDMPITPDAYTHRIGRTGRAERQGRAYTFVTPEDKALVRAVEKRIGSEIPRQSIEGFSKTPSPDQAQAEPFDSRRQRQGSRNGNGRGESSSSRSNRSGGRWQRSAASPASSRSAGTRPASRRRQPAASAGGGSGDGSRRPSQPRTRRD